MLELEKELEEKAAPSVQAVDTFMIRQNSTACV
jgi:hypothetical protein